MGERVLVNFFYAHPVGHAVEALHYALGHHLADPGREVHVALNAATPVELAEWCPFVTASYAVEHPFLEPGPAPFPGDLPRTWEWVLDDGRRYQPHQLEMFPGMRDWYAAADRELATRDRSFAGSERAGYVPHSALRLDLPADARARAEERLGDGPAVAVLPGGSGPAELYPSPASWTLLADRLEPDARLVVVGKLRADGRTSTSNEDGVDALRTRPGVVDAVDLPLADQLALVERCGALLSPHSGFGLAALAVGTPWAVIGGGRWFEYFFNHVPFRSVVPDVARYPAYTTFGDLPVVDGRTPSMSDARIREDADRIVQAVRELVAGEVSYDDALADYFRDLARAVDPAAIFSIDGVHTAYVG